MLGCMLMQLKEYFDNLQILTILFHLSLQIIIEDIVDDAPIFGFAPPKVDRNSLTYPTTLFTEKIIDYDTDEPVSFLSDIYLRDDRQLQNITLTFESNANNFN